ncbi:tRNA pseudouridine synthase Pus10 [Neocloeon triangulifer]|uniref:tRNA pseudouridine synthase Pus10 n=1 Tax=Neocloeon triangulifer TaxID=2078957 RepID=UPI00286F8E39|nr:tRNA pseudouridine synthase Pus10 [Neocloeon triangulifer]
MNSAEQSEKPSVLESLGLCRLCRLRYTGVRKFSDYDCTAEAEVKSEEPPTKCRKEETCIACLGLLQHLTEDSQLQLIIDAIAKENYDSPVMTCAVSLPIALQIRAHSLELYLKGKLPGFDSTKVVPIKEAWKWACSQRVACAVNKESCSGATCDFLININVEYTNDKKECSALQEVHSEKFEERKKQKRKFHGQLYTRQGVEGMLNSTTKEEFLSKFDCPPTSPHESAFYNGVQCSHNAIFIAGRYNKFSRFLSQTPWLVEGERRMDGSVQELISTALETVCSSRNSKFVASGREDVDVRTLGRGRPFAVELPDPRKTFLNPRELLSLQKEINKGGVGLIHVRDLQRIAKEEMNQLKMGEESKSKSYEAFCVCLEGKLDPEKLSSLANIKNLVLMQKTPIRVLHRRPLATRSRTVIQMSAKMVDDKHFKLCLETQAGTYVKEFVHGDFGRTLPNLCTLLGASVDILALDVKEVFLDWPKQIDESLDN